MRLCLAVLLAFATAGAQAQDFSSLEERMSAAEFRAAGLEKLSPDELAALNAWLQVRATATPVAAPSPGYVPAPAGDDRIGFKGTTGERSVVSRLVGPFTGWDGDTRFELENGQIWQQAESTSLKGVNVDSPAVTIEPAFLGSWLLRVDGFNQRVRVRRIK